MLLSPFVLVAANCLSDETLWISKPIFQFLLIFLEKIKSTNDLLLPPRNNDKSIKGDLVS